MGVYIFRSKHGPYIKVGHYQGQNAWSRVAHRGFYSCVCPDAIKDRVAAEDVELLAWFPKLTKAEERLIKKKWKKDRIYGKSEWFPLKLLDAVREELMKYDCSTLELCDYDEAKAVRRRL
ncbi:MAG: hypothetical protein EB060_12270 [Proteobacteria bacterium]|nr:hypothetical protein [Pseudomonadota bacterium]